MTRSSLQARMLKIAVIAAVLVSFAVCAMAADVAITITDNPTSAKQGETKTFTINVSATGNLNPVHSPTSVRVDTAYTAGGGSSSPVDRTFTSEAEDPDKPNKADVEGGPYAISASVTVPAGLTPGSYEIQVSATALGNGLGLPATLPSFSLQVEQAGQAPSVTIITPANGGVYKVNETILAAVEVESDVALSGTPTALLNGAAVTLTFDGQVANVSTYVATIQLTKPGANSFVVTAVNSAGSSSATSNFAVRYDLGGWLPPITTAKFQPGRTLPVKFRVNDYYGPTEDAVAQVCVDGVSQGTAAVYYDNGVPFYQLDVKLPAASGSCEIKIVLDDGITNDVNRVKSIQLK